MDTTDTRLDIPAITGGILDTLTPAPMDPTEHMEHRLITMDTDMDTDL